MSAIDPGSARPEVQAPIPSAGDPSRANRGGFLIGGLILIGLGVLFLLDNFEIADFGDVVRRYWPMIVVGLGASKLSQSRGMWSGLWLMAVGVWMQLCTLHLFGLTWGNSWPLLLIVLGAGITVRALVDASRRGVAS